MKRLTSTIVILVLSSGLAFAQSGFGGMRSTTPNMPNNPTPQPSNEATVGHGAGMNPSNSQDLSNRSNPQDLTRSGASNPESLMGR
jgi:hypothetical protein